MGVGLYTLEGMQGRGFLLQKDNVAVLLWVGRYYGGMNGPVICPVCLHVYSILVCNPSVSYPILCFLACSTGGARSHLLYPSRWPVLCIGALHLVVFITSVSAVGDVVNLSAHTGGLAHHRKVGK